MLKKSQVFRVGLGPQPIYGRVKKLNSKPKSIFAFAPQEKMNKMSIKVKTGIKELENREKEIERHLRVPTSFFFAHEELNANGNEHKTLHSFQFFWLRRCVIASTAKCMYFFAL